MLYKEYLETLSHCPFCDSSGRELVSLESAYLTYARAPYHEHHMLIIPRQHKVSLFELHQNEKDEIEVLVQKAMDVLKVIGYSNFTMLVREGDNGTKSIPHLHYHVIPETEIGDLDHTGAMKRILDSDEIVLLSDELKVAIDKVETGNTERLNGD